MFTGIIAELGSVVRIEDLGGSARITVRAGAILEDLPGGGSLAVNGVCLTAVPAGVPLDDRASVHPRDGEHLFTADVMGETLTRTTLGRLAPGHRVNLERCLPAHGRLDGHIVQGHVDGIGRIAEVEDHGSWRRVRVEIPEDLAPLMVEKGSIALQGVSLTLTAVSPPHASPAWVEVGLIPATLAATTFGEAGPGEEVNVEADVLAKHAQRLFLFHTAPGSPGLAPAAPRPAATPPADGDEIPGGHASSRDISATSTDVPRVVPGTEPPGDHVPARDVSHTAGDGSRADAPAGAGEVQA
ncbi:riboflavin synthase [Sediminivirga luteola]|uniref:riboflavin synthase n=1 Tax=Sediminivirga luteola TaxID=1774748 RepID=UPI001F56240D|nr:riboflavin synthase [Sediminivirga luteola]